MSLLIMYGMGRILMLSNGSIPFRCIPHLFGQVYSVIFFQGTRTRDLGADTKEHGSISTSSLASFHAL